MTNLEFLCEETNVRIDVFLSNNVAELNRTMAQKLCADGNVTCNGKEIAKSYKLAKGDKVCVNLPQPKELDVVAQDIPLDIVYEDECLIIVNKPKGMVVHPAHGNPDGTLVNALLYHCKGNLSAINGVLRPGIVHRIDKDTSGLLVAAKNNETHSFLSQQFAQHSITRNYHAVVYGKMPEENGFVEASIGRHPLDRKRMAVRAENSKYAYTSYEVVQRYRGFTHVELSLKTGRTHQIRVHMAHIGHPVAGDSVYGPKKCITELNGQCLHAKNLGFIHPKTNEYIKFESELPEYFLKFIKKMPAL